MPTPRLRATERHHHNRLVLSMLVLVCASGFAAADQNQRATPEPATPALRHPITPMKIQITADGAVIATASLDDNNAARDFVAMLPLTLPLRDYAGTEKIADLPRKLSTSGSPKAYTPAAGDISFYAPWGNVAIFYKNGELSSGLVRLGRIDTGLAALQRLGAGAVRVERATP